MHHTNKAGLCPLLLVLLLLLDHSSPPSPVISAFHLLPSSPLGGHSRLSLSERQEDEEREE